MSATATASVRLSNGSVRLSNGTLEAGHNGGLGRGRPMQSAAIDGGVMVTLRRLAALDRRPAGAGELAAARLLCGALQARGARAWIEEERVHGTYWLPLGLLSATGALAGLRAGRTALAGGALSAALLVDDLELGPRLLRRALRWRTAHNVLAELGPASASRTLVIHAHHDAAPSGLVFHPAIARAARRLAGRLIASRAATPAPMWTVLAGPALVAAGGAAQSPRLRRPGTLLSAACAAAMANIAASATVPGANDDLSGVGVLLELADELVRRPPRSLRVLLLSTGSEESLLEGMERFGERHFETLTPERTTFLCLESVGSATLMLLSGEGLLRTHRYPAELTATLGGLAQHAGVPLHDPFRFRLATDGQVPLRAGYPTAVLSSMGADTNAPANHHWPSDTTDRLDLDSIGGAARLAGALIRHLDAD